jgi:hypothetical protein
MSFIRRLIVERKRQPILLSAAYLDGNWKVSNTTSFSETRSAEVRYSVVSIMHTTIPSIVAQLFTISGCYWALKIACYSLLR